MLVVAKLDRLSRSLLLALLQRVNNVARTTWAPGLGSRQGIRRGHVSRSPAGVRQLDEISARLARIEARLGQDG